jgi:hypothetical protein
MVGVSLCDVPGENFLHVRQYKSQAVFALHWLHYGQALLYITFNITVPSSFLNVRVKGIVQREVIDGLNAA